MEDIEFYLEHAEEMMVKALEHVNHEFVKIRAGKAMPGMLDGIIVEYYGNPTPLNQVSTINTPDAKTIMIRPWEKNLMPEIEKAIINSDLGFNPQNDGEQVIINIPILTEDRRIELVKQAKHEAEIGRISLRSTRKEANENIRKLLKEHVSEDEVKGAEDKIQEITNEYSKKIDDLMAKKEVDIMHA
jgi:ribosome recycling factor